MKALGRATGCWLLVVGCWLLCTAAAFAQPAGIQPRDPLMSLMISQPRLFIPPVTQATAVFDPPVVRPGEQTIFRVTFNTLDQFIEWPDRLPAPPQLEVSPGAHGQILQMSATNYEPRSAYNTHVRAAREGVFTMPEFAVQVDGKPVTVPAARLDVVAAPPAPLPPAAQLILEVAATNLLVGQPVLARAVLPAAGGVVQALNQAQFSGQGFLVDVAGLRQRIEVTQHNGVSVPTFIYETTLTPLTAGNLTVFAQGFTAGNRFSGSVVITGPVTIPGGPPQYRLLESEPVALNVRPLPREGELPGFTGAIGSFSVGPPKLATNVLQVGDPVQLTVSITNRGDAPLARLVPPPAPKTHDWQVVGSADFAPAQAVGPPPIVRLLQPTALGQPDKLEGVVTFTYTLLPLDEKARATPPISFSCYDPQAGRYVDLTIPSVPVTVKPGSMPGDFAALQQAGALTGEPEKELTLSSLAASRGRSARSLVPPQEQSWFPILQLAPAAAFLGLLSWDRRRRYLEKHPEVVLRRRARRALRREWRALRRAARAADASGFAATAVSAMRVACAPHYPAEPRALVGGDVLPLLAEPDRSGRPGEVVRRFFAVTDAACFGTAKPNGAELLPLQPEVERILEQLEARL
jgi:hypothetical protein